jgi:hypothetical protein
MSTTSINVYGRWCFSDYHSGHPYFCVVSDDTTMGQIAELFKEQNHAWFASRCSRTKFNSVSIIQKGNIFYDDNTKLKDLSLSNNKLYLTFGTT